MRESDAVVEGSPEEGTGAAERDEHGPATDPGQQHLPPAPRHDPELRWTHPRTEVQTHHGHP